MKYLLPSLLIILLLFSNLNAQQPEGSKALQRPSPTPRIPGGIVLLPDYAHEVGRGIDTRVGSILKKNGLNIRYDIGFLAGNAAGMASLRTPEVAWYKGQVFGIDELWMTGLKDGRIVATFIKSDANFFAKPLDQDQLTDFFLMLMTFKPDDEYIRKRSEFRPSTKP